MKKHLNLLLLTAATTIPIFAQNVNKVDAPQMLRTNTRKEIKVPEINGYKALKGDFHLHTIFSDGSVLPNVRVDEAWRNGLDVIAITDHIEYRPNSELLKGDHNTSYNMAIKRAKELGIHLIKATEITESKPKGGHINALFITDANPMERQKDSPDASAAVDAAISQGAYLIWNHPGWAIDTCKMFELNEKWIKEGKIKGVEVFNEKEYYPRVATWCKDLKLAPFANTDAHATVSDTYADGITPPYTIVLATANSIEAIKEAMFAGRTIAIFNNQACAEKKLLSDLFEACTKIEKLSSGKYKITNISDIPFEIKSETLNGTLPSGSSIAFEAKTGFDAQITNLHIDEVNNLTTRIKVE